MVLRHLFWRSMTTSSGCLGSNGSTINIWHSEECFWYARFEPGHAPSDVKSPGLMIPRDHTVGASLHNFRIRLKWVDPQKKLVLEIVDDTGLLWNIPWYCCSHAFLCQWPTVVRHDCCLYGTCVEKPKTSSRRGMDLRATSGTRTTWNLIHCCAVLSSMGSSMALFHGESRRNPGESYEHDWTFGWFHGEKICWVDVFASSFCSFPIFFQWEIHCRILLFGMCHFLAAP